MNESVTEFIRKWNTAKTEREKLQDVYLLLGVAIIVISGLITFINVEVGYVLVTIGLLFLGAFVINGISWHLLSSIFLSKYSSRAKKK